MYYAVTRNNHGAFGYVPRGREVGFGIRDVQCGGILSVGWKKLWEKGGVGCSRNSFVSKICVCVWGGGGVYGKCQFVPCIQGFKALCNNKNIIDIQGVKKHVLQTLRGRGRIAQNIQMDSFGDTEDYSFW